MHILTCVHTLHKNANIDTKYRYKNAYLYMCTYPQYQPKQKQKGLLPKFPVFHVYILYTTSKTLTKRPGATIVKFISVHTFNNNNNMNTKACC